MHLLDPFLFGFVQTSSEASQDYPVCIIDLPVCLWVLDRCEVLDSAQLGNKFLEIFIRELCPIVGDNCLGNAKLGKNISFEEPENVLHGYSG